MRLCLCATAHQPTVADRDARIGTRLSRRFAVPKRTGEAMGGVRRSLLELPNPRGRGTSRSGTSFVTLAPTRSGALIPTEKPTDFQMAGLDLYLLRGRGDGTAGPCGRSSSNDDGGGGGDSGSRMPRPMMPGAGLLGDGSDATFQGCTGPGTWCRAVPTRAIVLPTTYWEWCSGSYVPTKVSDRSCDSSRSNSRSSTSRRFRLGLPGGGGGGLEDDCPSDRASPQRLLMSRSTARDVAFPSPSLLATEANRSRLLGGARGDVG
jgi:hypothetical protein